MTKSTSEPVWTRERALTLAALIGCLSIYGITISLFTPLLSLILESRAASSTLIGGLAMMTPLGVILGSFFVPRYLQIFSGRRLLLTGIGIEILLIIFLLAMSDLASWFVIRFFMGVTGSVLFIVSDSWGAEITPDAIRGRVMGLYNTVLLFSFALGLKSLALADFFCTSIIKILLIPVRSSICSVTVTPSIKSSNTIIPAASATIG